MISKEELELNASLQKKKNSLRKELSQMGILAKKGQNDYDHYAYFSESQYKELFTGLLSKHNLELNFTEEDYIASVGTSQKMPNVRTVKLKFTLIDVETGYSEDTLVTGEAFDKSDKAGYKAYTGALKYYLANKFLVATGEDPETESVETTTEPMITKQQMDSLNKYPREQIAPFMTSLKKQKLSYLTEKEAQQILNKLGGK